MGLLVKKTVQGGHKATAASGPQVITSADVISVLFFYSFHWDEKLMETVIKPTDILCYLLSQVAVLRFMAREQ